MFTMFSFSLLSDANAITSSVALMLPGLFKPDPGAFAASTNNPPLIFTLGDKLDLLTSGSLSILIAPPAVAV